MICFSDLLYIKYKWLSGGGFWSWHAVQSYVQTQLHHNPVLMTQEAQSDLVLELIIILYRLEAQWGSLGCQATWKGMRKLKRCRGAKHSSGLICTQHTSVQYRFIINRIITDVWQKEWENSKRVRHCFLIENSVKKEDRYLGRETEHRCYDNTDTVALWVCMETWLRWRNRRTEHNKLWTICLCHWRKDLLWYHTLT